MNYYRSLPEIVEIYSDATKNEKTTIVAIIYNIGMKAGVFKVQLIQFPLSPSKNFTKIQSLETQIFPFHRYSYILNVYGSLINSNINCTCKILNSN